MSTIQEQLSQLYENEAPTYESLSGRSEEDIDFVMEEEEEKIDAFLGAAFELDQIKQFFTILQEGGYHHYIENIDNPACAAKVDAITRGIGHKVVYNNTSFRSFFSVGDDNYERRFELAQSNVELNICLYDECIRTMKKTRQYFIDEIDEDEDYEEDMAEYMKIINGIMAADLD